MGVPYCGTPDRPQTRIRRVFCLMYDVISTPSAESAEGGMTCWFVLLSVSGNTITLSSITTATCLVCAVNPNHNVIADAEHPVP